MAATEKTTLRIEFKYLFLTQNNSDLRGKRIGKCGKLYTAVRSTLHTHLTCENETLDYIITSSNH